MDFVDVLEIVYLNLLHTLRKVYRDFESFKSRILITRSLTGPRPVQHPGLGLLAVLTLAHPKEPLPAQWIRFLPVSPRGWAPTAFAIVIKHGPGVRDLLLISTSLQMGLISSTLIMQTAD